MRNPISARCTLSICAAIAMLGGCNNAATVPTPGSDVATGGAADLHRHKNEERMGGGAFNGGYSGTAKSRSCVFHGYDGQFKFTGAGAVSFLGQSEESGNLRWNGPRATCSGWAGHVVLRSSKYPRVRIKMQVSGRAYSSCPTTLSYTVTGGTGRFYHATGSGTVAFTCSGSAYSDQWSGTISF